MSKQYDLTTVEILECLKNGKHKKFGEEFSGFSANEIQEAEERLGVSFPVFYKEYMTKYAAHPINNICDRLFAPEDIASTYDYLSEDAEEYAEDLEDVDAEEIEKMCEENAIYRLCQLPKENWDSVTEDYILIACENQGVWNAGYLRKDLENGVQNPPVYMSTNDDLITFAKVAENTEQFLKHLFFMSTWCLENVESLDKKDDVINALQKNHLDVEKMTASGVNFCKDAETNQLFACSGNGNDSISLLTAKLK